jgi:hypothetical protein
MRTLSVFRFSIPIALTLLLLGTVSCAPRPLPRASAPAQVDPKFSMTSYIEDGNLVTLIVGTRPTRYREERAYIPLEVAVANKGLTSLTLTRESFTLVDQDGQRYPAATPRELAERYGNLDLDRRLGEIEPVVASRFISYSRIPSNFSPGFDVPIERRVLHLPRFGYALDYLYFPRPGTGVLGRRFELFVNAPELPSPVFVRFEVEGSPARRD